MAKKEEKPKSEDFAYLMNTPLDKIIDDEEIEFAGETVQERLKGAVRFTKIRNILQKGSLTSDEASLLFELMKEYVKPGEKKAD